MEIDLEFTAGEAYGFLIRAIGDCVSLANWNDAPERTFTDIKAVLSKAIGLARAEDRG